MYLWIHRGWTFTIIILGAYSKVNLFVLLSNFAQCALPCARLNTRSMDSLGTQHCAKFESNTNRMTFEYALNMMIVKVHPQYWIILEFSRSLFENDDAILFHTTQHKTYYPILGTPNKNLPSESSTSHNSKWSHHTKIFNIDGKFSKFQHNLENRKI